MYLPILNELSIYDVVFLTNSFNVYSWFRADKLDYWKQKKHFTTGAVDKSKLIPERSKKWTFILKGQAISANGITGFGKARVELSGSSHSLLSQRQLHTPCNV